MHPDKRHPEASGCRCLIQPLSTEAILAGPAGEQAVLVRDSLLWSACAAQNLQQLKRLTLATDDPAAAAQAFANGASSRAETAGYDLLAVQPLSERLLQQVPSQPHLVHASGILALLACVKSSARASELPQSWTPAHVRCNEAKNLFASFHYTCPNALTSCSFRLGQPQPPFCSCCCGAS